MGIPQQGNEQFGLKAEPLIFPVCTDTGCACYSLKSHIRRSDVPAFSEAGTLFYSPVLKKRQKNVRCIVERFLRPAKNSGQIPQKCPFVIWKENFFAAILNKRQKGVRCKVKGFPKYFFTLPDIFAFSVRWIVKSEDVGTKPVSDSLSWIATVNGLFTVNLPSITPMKERF